MPPIDESTRAFERLEPTVLEAEIRRCLEGAGRGPLWLLDRDHDQREIVVRLYRNSHDRDFQRRFEDALVRLVRDPDISDPSRSVYASNLVKTIGDTGADAAFDRLRVLADGRFEGVTVGGDDLHGTILQVLLGFQQRFSELEGLFEVNFEKPAYAAICYAAFPFINPPNILLRLPDLTRQAERHPDLIDYDYLVYSVVGVANRDAVFNRLPWFFEELTESQYTLLLHALLTNFGLKDYRIDLETQEVQLFWDGKPAAVFRVQDRHERIFQVTWRAFQAHQRGEVAEHGVPSRSPGGQLNELIRLLEAKEMVLRQ